MSAEKVCLAAVAGPHGVRGLVKLKTFTEVPEDVAAYGPLSDEAGMRRFAITLKGRSKGGVIAALEGVETRDQAEALKGLRLYVERAALPATEDADTFYHGDLVGLPVEDPAGRPLGKVRALHDFGAGDLIELTTPEGKSRVLPFTKQVIPVVDLAGGRIVADPPEEIEAGQEESET